jgi:hypothetical protein
MYIMKMIIVKVYFCEHGQSCVVFSVTDKSRRHTLSLIEY